MQTRAWSQIRWLGSAVAATALAIAGWSVRWGEAPAARAAAGPRALWVDTTRTITPLDTVSGAAARARFAPDGAAGVTAFYGPKVSIAPGSSPGGGYLALSLFGVLPLDGVGDDTVTTFNVPSFRFGERSYTKLGFSSNGYAIIGDGTSNSIFNQSFPDATVPNNVLAPFWTDLNPGASGAMRISTLTDGTDTWIVMDWAAVREFSTGSKAHSLEIWIGIDSDPHPGEDVSFAYGPNTGNGDGGFLTVGAENRLGSFGAMTYFNGAGTLPTNGTELRVTTDTSTVTFLPLGLK